MNELPKKSETLLRLSKVLLKDKEIPKAFEEAFAAEIKGILNAYFEIPAPDITVELSAYPDGIRVCVEALANRIKAIKFI